MRAAVLVTRRDEHREHVGADGRPRGQRLRDAHLFFAHDREGGDVDLAHEIEPPPVGQGTDVQPQDERR